MRLFLAFLLLPFLAAAAPTDWRNTTRLAPDGAYVTGNPAARVKLVEYGSYTCPHCAAFSGESEAVLKNNWIRSGQVSLEYRHLVRDALDMTAAIVARCTGPRGFAATSADIFAKQSAWIPQAEQFAETNAARLQTYPDLARLRAYADGSGLSDIGRAHGLTDARLSACFADQKEVDRLVAMTGATPKEVTGTPSFYVNGRLAAQTFDWAHLQPILRAAGAK